VQVWDEIFCLDDTMGVGISLVKNKLFYIHRGYKGT
jgi:hypothetical protein